MLGNIEVGEGAKIGAGSVVVGDYGIEGFTFDGDLFQCYSPQDEEFSSKMNYKEIKLLKTSIN